MTEQNCPPKKSGLMVPILVIICIGIVVGLVGYYLGMNAARSAVIWP